jgi:hypothetical protein
MNPFVFISQVLSSSASLIIKTFSAAERYVDAIDEGGKYCNNVMQGVNREYALETDKTIAVLESELSALKQPATPESKIKKK